MASLIQGFEYDIFISYRQKDNKYDGWVTEFNQNLKKELEATFKEDISIYFDENPHDGLRETHNVDKSLESKLKCLIFIPIISQTYCDPKSFAWQHEFLVFNKMASDDLYGRDIKLNSGNVASRILPVRIHDLDQEDRTLLENELGGALRGIDFIFKYAGVNRPLLPSDVSEKNLNKTYYRDQINKVANAVKEIITSLKKYNPHEPDYPKEVHKVKANAKINHKTKIIAGSLIILTLAVLTYLLIPGMQENSDTDDQLEKSIAVLPFRNLSNDSTQAYFCDGFMEEVLNNLQRVREFTVRSRTSTDQYRNTNKTVKDIGEEMNVKYLVQGSVGRDDQDLKVWIQLIDVNTDRALWSNDYTREMKQIFSLQNEIAKEIAGELKTVLSPEELVRIDKKPTDNLEAYNYYLRGMDYSWRSYEKQNFEIAASLFRKAIESDPDFALAYVRLSLCYLQLNWFHYDKNIDRLTKAKEAIDAALKIDPDMPDVHIALGTYYYQGFLDYTKALEQVRIVEEKSKNNYECYYLKGNIYRRAGKWPLAKENYLNAYKLDPGSSPTVHNIAVIFSLLGEYQEAEKYFSRTISLNPTFVEAIWQKSFMYMKWKGNTIQARETIKEASQFLETNSKPLLFESNVLLEIYDGNYQKALTYLSSKDFEIIEIQFYINLKSLLYARVYSLMNMPEKAYDYFDSARVSMESRIMANPDDPRYYSTLGIAYAGLGQKEKAISAGKRGVELMPISKEAYRGVFRVEDLARIYVMTGEYSAALEQIKLLLDIPSRLSIPLLKLDPAWKPLWNLPEFKKIIN